VRRESSGAGRAVFTATMRPVDPTAEGP
jgi:hypothetical protein